MTVPRSRMEARPDLAARLPAPRRPGRHGGARQGPLPRRGRAQADRARLRAGAARRRRSAPRCKLGEDQLPAIWVLQRQVFNTLDMERVPDLYMTQYPFANAFTIGTQRPIVVLNSELVRLLDDDGRRVVLAHEAAHVHSDHVLYRTALLILLRLGARRAPADPGRAAAARDPARAAGVVARRRAVLRPRGGARHARPAGRLPRADGDRRPARPPRTSTSTPSSPRAWSTRERLGARADHEAAPGPAG